MVHRSAHSDGVAHRVQILEVVQYTQERRRLFTDALVTNASAKEDADVRRASAVATSMTREDTVVDERRKGSRGCACSRNFYPRTY